eukprot:scaffold8360_cov122-Isochrysis_galbana.AAC.4
MDVLGPTRPRWLAAAHAGRQGLRTFFVKTLVNGSKRCARGAKRTHARNQRGNLVRTAGSGPSHPDPWLIHEL